jgi:hypothetical protein
MSYCYDKGIPHSKFLTWEAEDKAKVLAYIMEQNTRCSLCGTAAWEWEENKFAYTAVDEFCRGCYQKAMYKDTESNTLPGTNVRLTPTTPILKAKMVVSARKRASAKRKRDEAQSGAGRSD